MRCQLRVPIAVALFALLNLSSFASWAQASPSDEASKLLDQGIDLRVEKRDAEALELFVRANTLSPSPRAIAQIGLAEQALGRWVPAEEHLSAALASSSDPWIQKARPVLEDGLRVVRTHLGSLQIEVNVANAEVVVNGAVVATTPMSKPARVPASSAVIVIRAKGYVPVEVRRSIAADELVRETVSLVAEPAATATTLPAPTTTPPAGSPPGADSAPPPAEGSGSSQRTWGYVAAGVGVAGLAATGILAGLAVSKTGDLPQACKDDPNGGCTPSQGDDINAARSYAGIANVTAGVGLVGLGFGTWLLLSAPSEPEKAGNVRVLPEAGVGFGGVRVGGRF